MKIKLFFISTFSFLFLGVFAQYNKIEHKVILGETIEELAYIYQTETDSIILWNLLLSETLLSQQNILIKDYKLLSSTQIEINRLRYQLNTITTEKGNKETYFNMQLQELEMQRKALDPNNPNSIFESMDISKNKKYFLDSLGIVNSVFDSQIETLSNEIKAKESYLIIELELEKVQQIDIEAETIDLDEIIKTQQASKDSALAYIEKQEKLAIQAEQERILLEKAMKEKAAKEAAQQEKTEKEKAAMETFNNVSYSNMPDTPKVLVKELSEDEALNAAILKAEQARLQSKNQKATATQIAGKNPENVKVSSQSEIKPLPVNTSEKTTSVQSSPQNEAKAIPIKEVEVNASKVKSKYKLGDEVSQVRKEKAKFLLTCAKLEIDKNDYKKAISFIDKSISMNPSDAEAYQMKGDIWTSVQYFDKALESYENALLLEPYSAPLFYNMGNCYIYLKKPDQAIIMMDQAIAFNPQYVLALSVRAGLLFEKQNYQAAIDDYTAILSYNAYFYPALRGRAMSYLNLDNYSAAIQDFNQFIAYDTTDASVYYHLGLAKMYTENFYDACMDFLKSKDLGFEPAGKAIKKYCE